MAENNQSADSPTPAPENIEQPTPNSEHRSENAPPPAAALVSENPGLSTDMSELVELRRRASDLEREKREREERISKLEDENRTLKTPSTPAEKQKKGWLEGSTFLD